MHREIIVTEDGSHTVVTGERKIAYHSRHGAIQESAHVYINSGFDFVTSRTSSKQIRIFEMGFGTGLNGLLTLRRAAVQDIKVEYTTVETERLSGPEARQLNYCRQLQEPSLQPRFDELHDAAWETHSMITPLFTIEKLNTSVMDYEAPRPFDLIYYDAFAPSAQPELWTTEVFEKLLTFVSPGGILVTYCSKGDVKRALKNAGWKIRKVPGPLYKRDIIRAIRPDPDDPSKFTDYNPRRRTRNGQ